MRYEVCQSVFGGLCANMLLSKKMVTRWIEDIGGNVEL